MPADSYGDKVWGRDHDRDRRDDRRDERARTDSYGDKVWGRDHDRDRRDDRARTESYADKVWGRDRDDRDRRDDRRGHHDSYADKVWGRDHDHRDDRDRERARDRDAARVWGLDDATRDRAHADRWSFLDDDQYDLEGWAARPGSLGSWMQKAASPMEARYLEEFITMLDRFEKKRGLDRKRASRQPFPRVTPNMPGTDGGIHVHLGPGLHAEIKFYITN